ncbi:hypothetical protein AN958_02598 [Leucoagaricus sp. SymC.cos]|nr:hypothetical protein AN958_02598 [Leucoagaricus sp. SymC.cos]
MLLLLARPILLSVCLYLLPNAIIEPTDDGAALPTPTSATTNKALYRDWRALLARTVFAWTFTESSMLFVLLICQATSTFSPSQRAENFQFSLYALLAIHIVLIPQSIALLVLSPTPAKEEIRSTETSLQSVQIDLVRKQEELERRTQASQLSTNEASTASSWMKRFGDTLRGGDDLTLEIKGLQALHSTLTLTLRSQRAKFAFSKRARTLRGRLTSFIGRLFAAYCVFRTFTAASNTIFLRSQPRSQSSTTYPDIVTNIMIWLLVPSTTAVKEVDNPSAQDETVVMQHGLRLTPESISSVTRHISLLLIGLIVLSSIGLVMRGVNRALKVTSKTLGTSLIVLVLSYLMGIYLLSTLVQLRSSFPPPLSDSSTTTSTSSSPTGVNAPPTNLFSLIPPWELFNSLFDLMFLVAAVVTAGARWGVDRLSMVD